MKPVLGVGFEVASGAEIAYMAFFPRFYRTLYSVAVLRPSPCAPKINCAKIFKNRLTNTSLRVRSSSFKDFDDFRGYRGYSSSNGSSTGTILFLRPVSIILLTLSLSACSLALYKHYDPDNFTFNLLTLRRSTRTACTIALIIIDYKWSLRNYHSLDTDNYATLKSECHQRCANRLLDLANANGGVYIKLGQHIAALVYLVPPEYTETLKVLQDKAPATSLSEIETLFLEDTGNPLSEIFSEFDIVPVGVASLAQVHRARLRESNKEVAVKIQHPSLDAHAAIDIKSCAEAAKVVRRIFPEFEFGWLAEEMELNLPKELDFVHEKMNSDKVKKNFEKSHVLKVPEVYWAIRRILVMECKFIFNFF
ncbi:hypothetical protein HK096_006234 [Nowakowskiella sp. JEL0078]|nr:hypothetical protein HK096_006234 [Nowakowskiella sp. JEL0078]